MRRFHADEGIPTLAVALSELMNAADLKKLAALTNEKLPTRKADLAAVQAAFRRALREVGYLLAPGAPHGANGRLLASVRS